jgi:hypothetical protein
MNKQGKGFVTFAQNTETVDYLKLAYLQALNIKSIHQDASYSVIVDKKTKNTITGRNWIDIFDNIIDLPYDENAEDSDWKLANEYQIFQLTPYKETIKLESDLLFTRSMNHWWSALRLKDIVFSYHCKNYRSENREYSIYRKFFVDNQLPDLYNGMMYFRYSHLAAKFFETAQQVLHSWNDLKTVLLNVREDTPSTDVLYAVTAKIIGPEHCTLPSLDFFNFVHLKPAINCWGNTDESWQNSVNSEIDELIIRVNNLNQYYPVHYYDKEYCTDELIDHYERIYRRSKLA